MAEHPRLTGADLIDRWLAHREDMAPTGGPPPRPAGPRRAALPVTITPPAPASMPLDRLTAMRLVGEAPSGGVVAAQQVRRVWDAVGAPVREPEIAPPPATSPATGQSAVDSVLVKRAAQEPDGNRIEFKPRTGARRLAALVLVLALVATAASAYAAWQEPRTPQIGTAVVFAVLTGLIWAVRAGSAPARLVVQGGQLEITRGGSRHVFDLASRYTPIEVVGEPGERGWRVLFLRRGMTPYVIDSSVVDPHEFMAVLRRYRPTG